MTLQQPDAADDWNQWQHLRDERWRGREPRGPEYQVRAWEWARMTEAERVALVQRHACERIAEAAAEGSLTDLIIEVWPDMVRDPEDAVDINLGSFWTRARE